MQTITIANNKGGCGKTTTAFNLALALAATDARVLTVDLDPQGNLSTSFGADLLQLTETRLTSHRLMLDRSGDPAAYLIHARPKVDLIPATLDEDAESMIDGMVSRELLLKERLAALARRYDYCVIDTPPALRAPTHNAIAMADMTIIPVDSSSFALVGITQLMRRVALLRQAHSPRMMIMALSTIYVSTQNIDRDIRAALKTYFKDNIFDTTIPRRVALKDSIAAHLAVVESNPNDAAAQAYTALATEILEWLGTKPNAENQPLSFTQKPRRNS